MPADRRPQDPSGDGARTFTTAEHGEYPDAMLQAIIATDTQGRTCTYVPLIEDGRAVDSVGFELISDEG